MSSLLVILGILVLIFRFFSGIIKYLILKTTAFDKKEAKKAAIEEASKLSYEDPVITCDYCGCKIDTKVDSVCPHCGASYAGDKEWILRHEASKEFIDKAAERIFKEREQKSKEEQKKVLKRVKKNGIILIAVFAVLLLLYEIGTNGGTTRQYRGNEKLSKADDDCTYVKADYKLKGNSVIYNKNNIKITVTGLYIAKAKKKESYYNPENASENVKIGFKVENNSNYNISLYMQCSSVNKVASENSGFYMYDTYRKHKTVQIYEPFRFVQNQTVSEFIIHKLSITDKDDYKLSDEIDKPIVMNTTANQDDSKLIDFKDKKQIFSNDKVDIYSKYMDTNSYGEQYYKIYVVNKTDKIFRIKDSNLKIDGKDNSTGFYDEFLYSGYIFQSDNINAGTNAKAKIECTISFKCNEDPSNDFSTGYLELTK